jgi:hypothetical protein
MFWLRKVLVFWTWTYHVLSIYWLSTGGFVPSERHPGGSRPSAARSETAEGSGGGEREVGSGRRRRKWRQKMKTETKPGPERKSDHPTDVSTAWNSGLESRWCGNHVEDTRHSGRSGEFETVTRNTSRVTCLGTFGNIPAVPEFGERKFH